MVTSQPLATPRRDPIARYAWIALVVLAVWINVRAYQSPAQAQDGGPGVIIYQSTPTPALPTPAQQAPALSLAEPTAAPGWLDQGLAAASATGDQFANDQAAALAAEQERAAATPDTRALVIEEQARATAAAAAQAAQMQAIADAPAQQALNDPRQNGNNMAPQGCPFPIVNGRCANGVLAKDLPGDSTFGSKSIADTGSDPAHESKATP